jgi:ABC-type protease/lipase transport system fused ATPase/permease subunit
VVLDEPNSNLDSEGEVALRQAIVDLKARGAIVVLIAHRPSVLAACDNVLVTYSSRCRRSRLRALFASDESLRGDENT